MAAASSNFFKVSFDTFRSVAVELFALIELFQSVCSSIAVQCSKSVLVNPRTTLSFGKQGLQCIGETGLEMLVDSYRVVRSLAKGQFFQNSRE